MRSKTKSQNCHQNVKSKSPPNLVNSCQSQRWSNCPNLVNTLKLQTSSGRLKFGPVATLENSAFSIEITVHTCELSLGQKFGQTWNVLRAFDFVLLSLLTCFGSSSLLVSNGFSLVEWMSSNKVELLIYSCPKGWIGVSWRPRSTCSKEGRFWPFCWTLTQTKIQFSFFLQMSKWDMTQVHFFDSK